MFQCLQHAVHIRLWHRPKSWWWRLQPGIGDVSTRAVEDTATNLPCQGRHVSAHCIHFVNGIYVNLDTTPDLYSFHTLIVQTLRRAIVENICVGHNRHNTEVLAVLGAMKVARQCSARVVCFDMLWPCSASCQTLAPSLSAFVMNVCIQNLSVLQRFTMYEFSLEKLSCRRPFWPKLQQASMLICSLCAAKDSPLALHESVKMFFWKDCSTNKCTMMYNVQYIYI